jgi:archaeal flagellar protein FlaJ
MIKVPYAAVPGPVLLRWAKKIEGFSDRLKSLFPKLETDLKFSEMGVVARDYIGMCFIASSMLFVFFFLILLLILARFEFEGFLLISFISSFIITLFVFIQQVYYPKLLVQRRVRSIEQNLMPALQNIMIQINSGVPLFDTLVNISFGGYGEISNEFKLAVKKIAAGEDEIEAIESLATRNASPYFRRTIWQMVNGMKAGSDISKVLDSILRNLGDEQLISIQKYGSQLSPLAMFYMMIAVILPSLGITLIIVLSSFVSLGEDTLKMIFYSLGTVVILFQLMFIGVIQSRRPNLMQ